MLHQAGRIDEAFSQIDASLAWIEPLSLELPARIPMLAYARVLLWRRRPEAQQKFEKALEVLEPVSTAAPGDEALAELAATYLNFGNMLTKRKAYVVALKRVDQALSIDSKGEYAPDAVHQRIRLLAHLGRFDESVVEYRRVSEQATQDSAELMRRLRCGSETAAIAEADSTSASARHGAQQLIQTALHSSKNGGQRRRVAQ